jgi:hypothetical protein
VFELVDSVIPGISSGGLPLLWGRGGGVPPSVSIWVRTEGGRGHPGPPSVDSAGTAIGPGSHPAQGGQGGEAASGVREVSVLVSGGLVSTNFGCSQAGHGSEERGSERDAVLAPADVEGTFVATIV